MEIEHYMYLAVCVGVLIRTLAPWAIEGGPWDWRYIWAAIGGLACGLLSGELTLPELAAGGTIAGAIKVGLVNGFAWQTAVRYIQKSIEVQRARTANTR